MRGALEGAVEGIGDRENGGDQLRPGDLHLVKLPVPRGVEVGHGALVAIVTRGGAGQGDPAGREQRRARHDRVAAVGQVRAEDDARLPRLAGHRLEALVEEGRAIRRHQPPFAPLRSGPKAPSKPSRQKQIPSRAEITKIAQNLPKTGVASSTGLKTMDRWHFDSASMITLGERYAAEMLKLQKKR